MIRFLEGKTLEEKQRRYYNGYTCPYCDQLTDYVDSAVVYQESHGMIHYCKNCAAWVGCHSGSDQSYGFVAKEPLRKLRHEAHQVFDPLWEAKIRRGAKRQAAQAAARKWMAGFMGLDITEAHIGMMDIDQCKRLISECKKWYISADEQEARKVATQGRIDDVKELCGMWDIDLREFNLSGMNQLEMRFPGIKKVLLYNPRKQIGSWLGPDQKWVPVTDVYEFITQSFKIANHAP